MNTQTSVQQFHNLKRLNIKKLSRELGLKYSAFRQAVIGNCRPSVTLLMLLEEKGIIKTDLSRLKEVKELIGEFAHGENSAVKAIEKINEMLECENV